MAAKLKSKPTVEPVDESTSESYISIGLGLLVVVVVGILLYNYFTQKNTSKNENKPVETTQEATTTAKPGAAYTVQDGDTLWSISEKAYGTGYEWTKIADANNLSEGDELEAGQELQLPESSITTSAEPSSIATSVTVEASPEPTASPVVQALSSPTLVASPAVTQPVTITDSSYTVVTGDSLWSIACRAYGDCYAWVRIRDANTIENPDIIHPGNVFSLPR